MTVLEEETSATENGTFYGALDMKGGHRGTRLGTTVQHGVSGGLLRLPFSSFLFYHFHKSAAALSYAVLGLLTRRSAAAAAPEIAACLMQLPLLLRLVSFLARDVSGRTAARCSAHSACEQKQQEEQRQSSYNLSYMSVAACSCVALFSLPIWVFVLQPPQNQEGKQAAGSLARAYPLAAAAFAGAGLLEAAGEVLYLRCLLLGSPWVRGTAEAAGTAARSLVLAFALCLQQKAEGSEEVAANRILLSPLMAFSAAQLGSSLLYLLLLWLQCHRLIMTTTEASRAAKPAAAEPRRFLAAWPQFQCLSVPTADTHLSGANSAGSNPRARTGYFSTALKRYLSDEHLQLLPTNLLLTLQKLILEYGEQLLLVLLLSAREAAEYALVSGAASIVCRVFFAPIEASAFEAFCALGAKPAAHATAPAGVASAADPRAALLRREEEGEAPALGGTKDQHSGMSQQGLHRRRAAPHHPQEPRKQRQQQQHQDHRESQLLEYGVSSRRQQRAACGFQANRRDSNTSPGMGSLLPSRGPARLLQFFYSAKFEQADIGLSSQPPGLLLLQSFLLLQGTLGMAAAAGGFLFGSAALRCVFGSTAVAPEATFAQTLTAYCLYICAISVCGLLDAYAAATCNTTGLLLLQRLYAGVAAILFLLLLPLFVHSFSVWGQAAAAGAAVAQAVAAVCRIFCCCACLSTSIPSIQLRQNENSADHTAGDALVPGANSSNNRTRSCGNVSKRCRCLGPSGLPEAAANQVEQEPARRSASIASTCAVLKAIQPPRSTDLLLRYGCCFALAAAAQAALRAAAFEAEVDTKASPAAQGYNAQQVRLGGISVPLWWAELSLGVSVCLAAAAYAGPLLLAQVRGTYFAAVAAADAEAQRAVHLNTKGDAPDCNCCKNTTAREEGSF
ncbi:hypothetical protein Emed_005082 [Eimeria media]